jgi:hypothetical protein
VEDLGLNTTRRIFLWQLSHTPRLTTEHLLYILPIDGHQIHTEKFYGQSSVTLIDFYTNTLG